MSCCEVSKTNARIPGTGCCGSSSCSSEKKGCLISEPPIRSCLCQENLGCLERADCGGFRPRGNAATGACPGPCQCVEEESWNRNSPPKPNCEWLSNFSQLRRQWSDHSRQQTCKCCNCHPSKKAAPCKPCIPSISQNTGSSSNCQDCRKERLSGGGSVPRSKNISSSPECAPDCPPTSQPTHQPVRQPARQSANSCQPCSPTPRSMLKKRSCCQCSPGLCMCQPMPRNCNCPLPVQIDARADGECICDCPSAPECACPPSERKFPRTQIKCPNAKLCCPVPRLPPSPKCLCSECQPCLPPPCDPCTSSKCKTTPPKTSPCQADSKCPSSAPCRPETPIRSSYPQPSSDLTPSTPGRKMSLTFQNSFDESLPPQVRIMNYPRSSFSRAGIASEDHHSCCCTGLETETQRRDDQESCDNFYYSPKPTNNLMCSDCSSLLSSNSCCSYPLIPARLCQDCENELQMQKFSEFGTEFENKSFRYTEQSRIETICEEEMEESCNDENYKYSVEIAECEDEDDNNVSEIEPAVNYNEREEKYIDQFEDNIQYCTDDGPLKCNATENVFKSREICTSEEEVDCNPKHTISNPLMEERTNPSNQIDCCSEKNLLEEQIVQKKISTGSDKVKLIPSHDSKHSCIDSIPCNKNRKTSKESEPKVRSSKNDSCHYKDVSFYDGWINLKNVLVSYFQKKISPNSCKPEEKLRNECKPCTPSDRNKIRKVDLNGKEIKEVVIQKNELKGDFCLNVINVNRRDSSQNSEKNSNQTERNKIENKVEYNKGVDKIKKNNKDTICAGSNCEISWLSDRALINDMKRKDNANYKREISSSEKKADNVLCPDDFIEIRNKNKGNFKVDGTNDDLNESTSNECLVHPGKGNFVSECAFRRNDNDRRVSSGEFRKQMNCNSCRTDVDETRKKEAIHDPMQRKNLFNGIKLETSKVQKH